MPLDAPPHRPPVPAAGWIVPQDWDSYSADDHRIWETLFARQSARIPTDLVPEFDKGARALELAPDRIPDFALLNRKLERLTGWTVVAVPGLIPERSFFELLASRQFPSGRFIRRGEELDYIAEPDVFHDVFGHVPMLADRDFADVTQRFGEIGLQARTEYELTAITRLYWFTVEFGLACSRGSMKAFGAGLASSPTELAYALRSAIPVREPFSIEGVVTSAYSYDNIQPLYFVIPSLKWLLDEIRVFDLAGAGTLVAKGVARQAQAAISKPRLSAASFR